MRSTINKLILFLFLCTAWSSAWSFEFPPIFVDGIDSYSLSIDGDGHPILVVSKDDILNGKMQHLLMYYHYGLNRWDSFTISPKDNALNQKNNLNYANYPEAIVGNSENIYAVWMDAEGIFCGTINDGHLVFLSNVTNNGLAPGTSMYPDLSLDSHENVYIAWNQQIEKNKNAVFVKYYNGNKWKGLDGSDLGIGIGDCSAQSFPKISVNTKGTVFVAWENSSNEICVKSWNKDKWIDISKGQEKGNVLLNEGISKNPALVLNAAGNPVLAWCYAPFDKKISYYTQSQINCEMFDDGQWFQMGKFTSGTDTAESKARFLSIVLSSKQFPIMTWDGKGANTGSDSINIKRWDGVTWIRQQIGLVKYNCYSLPVIRKGKNGTFYISYIDTSQERFILKVVSFADDRFK